MQKMNRIILRRGTGKPGIETTEKAGLRPYEIGANTNDGNIYYHATYIENGEEKKEIRCILSGDILTTAEINKILDL